jgi:hypothetical protein
MLTPGTLPAVLLRTRWAYVHVLIVGANRGHGDRHARCSEYLPPLMPFAHRAADGNLLVFARPGPQTILGGPARQRVL